MQVLGDMYRDSEKIFCSQTISQLDREKDGIFGVFTYKYFIVEGIVMVISMI